MQQEGLTYIKIKNNTILAGKATKLISDSNFLFNFCFEFFYSKEDKGNIHIVNIMKLDQVECEHYWISNNLGKSNKSQL